MKIKEINPETLKKVSDEELLSLHRRTHQLYTVLREGDDFEGAVNLEDIVNAHLQPTYEGLKQVLGREGPIVPETICSLPTRD